MPRENGAPVRANTPEEPAPNNHPAAQAPGAHVPGAHDGANTHGPQGHHIVDTNLNAIVNQFGGLGINGIPHIPGMIQMQTPDGRFVHVATNFPSSGVGAPGIAAFGYAPPQAEAYPAPYGASYYPPGGYPPQQVFALSPYTPARAGNAREPTDTSSRDVPGLDIRRSSYSTNESTPATPFLGSMASRDQGARVTVFDRSAYTTPSPQQIVPAEALQEPKSPLLDRDPKIPFAVPAVFTPPENMKTLEQSLVNPIPGNRNVYIRGLHPTTDDALLLKYAERFGPVETSKAIIDSNTGACKGFGFAKFYDVRHSENCIRGFYRRGYEVGFARESFNSRLRAEGDETSTNLYLSNLPKSYTETEINLIFDGYTILSSKVLRDGLGNSRGVGFARFESREICDRIIEEFTGTLLGRERLPLQIRYADTPRQKELKRVTAKRRQYRTNEYNVSAYGTTLVGMSPAHGYNYRHTAYTPGVPGVTSHGNSGLGGSSVLGSIPGDGVEIRVESPLVAHGSSQSSPVKQEKE